jgi:hypothetical protein
MEPNPIVVLILIRDGFPVTALASSIAAAIASRSLSPSLTTIVCQSWASNLFKTFSVNPREVSP